MGWRWEGQVISVAPNCRIAGEFVISLYQPETTFAIERELSRCNNLRLRILSTICILCKVLHRSM